MFNTTNPLVGHHYLAVSENIVSDTSLSITEDSAHVSVNRIRISIARYEEDQIREVGVRQYIDETFEKRGIPRGQNIMLYVARCCNEIAERSRRGCGNVIYANSATITKLEKPLSPIYTGRSDGSLEFRDSDLFQDDEFFLVYEGSQALDWPFAVNGNQIASHDKSGGYGFLLTIKDVDQ